jgi:hypothetical protein
VYQRDYCIHGDNIVECMRAFDYAVAGLGAQVTGVKGPLRSVTCPTYIILCGSTELSFQFFPGYGERRWNQDILNFVKRTGGRLREAADAIITRVENERETPLAAIEFCGALPAGNQAWQRHGRAFSYAHAQIPYFFISELGGFELASDRKRKAERMPNPAIPFSFFAITQYRGSVCLPVYEANSGARSDTIERYSPIYGRKEFLEFLRLSLANGVTAPAAALLSKKCFALVEMLADAKKRQDGLSSAQWREAAAALEAHRTLPDYLNESARIAWSKTAYIQSLTKGARAFMALGKTESFGLTSSNLPLSFVPKGRRVAFARKARMIFPDMDQDFAQWLGQDRRNLAIAWVMGFKPRGDDARPDRGLPPLARMLVGDETELLSFIYGPAPGSHWTALSRDPVALAKSNGLWEAVLAVSDGVLVGSSTKRPGTPRGYLKARWTTALNEEQVPLMVRPQVLALSEQDVDTAIHVAFESLGIEIAFEGMCNPPGGDWSGISFRWDTKSPEHRWLTLPRVSAEGAKRPDHVFALFGYEQRTVCLCIESKETARALETNIGPRLKRYAEALFENSPSIYRAQKLHPWSTFVDDWSFRPVQFISAGAYLGLKGEPFEGLPKDTVLDMQISVIFSENNRRCSLYLRGDTHEGDGLVKYLSSLNGWGEFATVTDVNN